MTHRARRSRRLVAMVVPLVLVVVPACRAAHDGRQAGAASTGATADTAVPDRRGSVEVMTLRAAGSNAARDVWIYRPHGLETADLPVVYFLHGYPGHARDVIDNLAPELDAIFAAGAAPFILAAPDGNGEHHDDTEWADAVDGTDDVETFVTTEVIPAVEGQSPRTRGRRAIAGFSMGGYGAMNLGIRNSQLFSQVVSVAGYFHVDDPDGMFAGNPVVEAANSPDRRIAEAASLRVLLVDGADDHEPVVEGESQRMKALFDAAGVAATLDISAGVHGWAFVRSALWQIDVFLSDGWAGPGPHRGRAS